MIAHVSIPSADPRSTALLLAALIGGQAFAFPVVRDAWIAVAQDGSGMAIEVYPDGMAHHPGSGPVDPHVVPEGPKTMPWEDQIFPDGRQLKPSAFHMAITTELADERVLALARQAGLRAVRCNRGGVFGLIEIWLDNTILVEVLNVQDTERYRSFMNPAGCAAMFGAGEKPETVA